MPPKGADEASPRSGVRPLVPAAGAISRPGASAFFVSDGPISSNSGRNGGKNAGRNYVSALPQRAIPGSDLLRILAGIAFCRRCRIKGLCLRSPARRLTRPLASATAGVFAPTAAPPSLPLDGSAVLNDTPVACQTREPTDPQGDRWRGEAVTDEGSTRPGASAFFVSAGDSFAPRRELLLSAVTKVAKSTA